MLTHLPARIVHCPELGRDVTPLLRQAPGAQIQRAERTPGTQWGCLRAHQAIVREAEHAGWPAVWVLEDDCAFLPRFSVKQWAKDARWTVKHGYNVLLGGVFSGANPRGVRKGLVAVDRFKSTHCIVYFADAYPVVRELEPPMDYLMGQRGVRPVVTVPFVAVQRAGFSGITQRHADNLARYAETEAIFARVAA